MKCILKGFNNEMDHRYDFCGEEDETIPHLFFFFSSVYSRVFWTDLDNFLTRTLGTDINVSHFLIYFRKDVKDKQIAICYSTGCFTWKISYTQSKWMNSKANFIQFYNNLKYYSTAISNINTVKAIRTCNILFNYLKA